MVEDFKYLRSTVQISKGCGKGWNGWRKNVSKNEGTCVEDGGRSSEAVRLSQSHWGDDARQAEVAEMKTLSFWSNQDG